LLLQPSRPRTGRAAAHGIVSAALALVSVAALRAQTVRPVIAEHQEKARARFELVNESLAPLNVVLEPKSFSVDEDGSPIFRPLDKDIHLKLSRMSFRIPPRQTYYVFYEATADKYPAWFVIYATFAGLPQQSGLNVQVEIPHTVYLLQRQRIEEADVEVRSVGFDATSRTVNIELANRGDRFGRVEQVEISADRVRAQHPGFPLMPHNQRKLRVEWKSAEAPQRVLIRFKDFKVQKALSEWRN